MKRSEEKDRKACLLCTTWRSGSTHLGSVLSAICDLSLDREPLWLSDRWRSAPDELNPEQLVEHVRQAAAELTSHGGLRRTGKRGEGA